MAAAAGGTRVVVSLEAPVLADADVLACVFGGGGYPAEPVRDFLAEDRRPEAYGA